MAKNAASQTAVSSTSTPTSETLAADANAAGANATGAAQQPGLNAQGAQFVYAATTVANILCSNLTPAQVNLLGNFLSVITTSVFAILAVENPNEATQ